MLAELSNLLGVVIGGGMVVAVVVAVIATAVAERRDARKVQR